MLLGILSDSHDRRERTAQAVATLIAEGAEVLVHCGDLTGPDIVYECAERPSYYVFGNNDFDEAALRLAMDGVGGVCLGPGGIVTLAGRRVAITHGDSATQWRRLLAEAPDYLLFGHSHRKADRREGRTRLINPGALHRAPEWSVALLDLATDALRFLTIA